MNLEIIKYKVKSNNKKQSKTPEEIEKIRKYNREYYALVRKSKKISKNILSKNVVSKTNPRYSSDCPTTKELNIINSPLISIETGSFIVEF